MQYLKDSGFVVKRVNVGEFDRYVTLYTRDNGKIEVVARGVRKISSKRSSHIELLNHIRFQAIKTSKNFILTETQLINQHELVRKEVDDMGSLFLICELVEKLCPSHQHNRDIFALINTFLSRVDNNDREKHLYTFQVELLSALGYWDPGRTFHDLDDIRQFIEGILERKLKSPLYFTPKSKE